jgi:hypothetical protein
VIEPNIGRTGAAATVPAPVREPRASPPPREPIAREPLSREAVTAREPKTREPMTRESMTRDATLRPPPPIELQRLETLTDDISGYASWSFISLLSSRPGAARGGRP